MSDSKWKPEEGFTCWYIRDCNIQQGIIHDKILNYDSRYTYYIDIGSGLLHVDFVAETREECRQIAMHRLRVDIDSKKSEIQKLQSELSNLEFNLNVLDVI